MKIITNRRSGSVFGGMNLPREGIFWYIDDLDILLSLFDEVDSSGRHSTTDLLHRNAWIEFRDKYKVDGGTVPFDYYPRGRVMITTAKNSDGSLDSYLCDIYCDKCIMGNPDICDKIVEEFRLYLPKCEVDFCGELSIDSTHYTCHTCK